MCVCVCVCERACMSDCMYTIVISMILYMWKFSRYVNFTAFVVTYRYSKTLNREKLQVCNINIVY